MSQDRSRELREVSNDTTTADGNLLEGREIDIPDDIYGAAMFSIVYDTYEVLSTTHSTDELSRGMNFVRLAFVMTVLLTNYALQFFMLVWIYNYVVLPAMHDVESIYQKYHAETFHANGTENLEAWEDWSEDNKEQLCNIAFSSYWFMFAVLLLWCYTMLIEIRKTDRLSRDVKSIEDCSRVSEMIDESSGTRRIVKLTKCVDWLLFLVIILPKLFIGAGLLVIGCIWLMATDSFADLILNAVALEFVVNIDNLLFEAALPASIADKVAETKFFVLENMSKSAENKKIAWGYYRSMLYFFGTWVFVALMMSYGQLIPYAGVLPNYANDAACPVWQAQITERICLPGVDCFPYGD